MDETMNAMFPEVEYELSTGEKAAISPVKFGKLNKFNAVIPRLIEKLNLSGLAAGEAKLNLADVIDTAYEEVKTVMAIILDVDGAWVDNLSLEDAAGILEIIIEQNITSRFKPRKRNRVNFLMRRNRK
ncbi:MAG: hypothetical protein L7F77_09220 [Candidatus Magnetominusculus sp. LBB02]|nr:hypothetical protein [Candidatus Magnetominusculus sp. LBB02]